MIKNFKAQVSEGLQRVFAEFRCEAVIISGGLEAALNKSGVGAEREVANCVAMLCSCVAIVCTASPSR